MAVVPSPTCFRIISGCATICSPHVRMRPRPPSLPLPPTSFRLMSGCVTILCRSARASSLQSVMTTREAPSLPASSPTSAQPHPSSCAGREGGREGNEGQEGGGADIATQGEGGRGAQFAPQGEGGEHSLHHRLRPRGHRLHHRGREGAQFAPQAEAEGAQFAPQAEAEGAQVVTSHSVELRGGDS